MMRKQRYFLTWFMCFLALLAISSCKQWLQVKPIDKQLKSQVFESEFYINSALNAVYNSLAKESLYGGTLTNTAIDVMAQYFNPSSAHDFYQLVNFGYASTESQAVFEPCWKDAYATILSINDMLDGFRKYASPLSPQKDSIMRGELYGLRAMLHFDMLRLFGPVYAKDSVSVCIPYRKDISTALSPLLPANEVVRAVLADLDTAGAFLQADQVITQGKRDDVTNVLPDDFFFVHRNVRLNFYALTALQARVKLYKGDLTGAAKAAHLVIDQASKWFPWNDNRAHLNPSIPDRIFYPEILFGNYDQDRDIKYLKFFASNIPDISILAPSKSPDAVQLIFESNTVGLSDFRLQSWFQEDITRASSILYNKAFIKFANLNVQQNSYVPWAKIQPIIRISELYYILAECENDASYLFIVRQHRGLAEPIGDIDLMTELLKEYRKEFWGEGQLFFFYKRKNQPSIKNGTSTITMNDNRYRVPLTNAEVMNR